MDKPELTMEDVIAMVNSCPTEFIIRIDLEEDENREEESI